MDSIAPLLAKTLKKRGLYTHAHASHIVSYAERWLHEHLPDLSACISVTQFKDGSLTVSCTHSIAQQECGCIRNELLTHLQSAFGKSEENNVEEIRIIRARE